MLWIIAAAILVLVPLAVLLWHAARAIVGTEETMTERREKPKGLHLPQAIKRILKKSKRLPRKEADKIINRINERLK